jgi:RNA polymerase sigma-70 factor (ECF subfamily)
LLQRDLVQRAAGGDPDAFGALATATIGRLDAAARLILRDPESAKDAVQDAFARAWRDLPGLRDPDRFEAWLHRLLAHACYDELRRHRRRPIEVEITALDHPSIQDSQSASADRDALERGLRVLGPDLRTLIVLFYYLDMPLPEVAAAIGIPVGTAKSRLHRARREMRVALGAGAEDEQPRMAEGRA